MNYKYLEYLFKIKKIALGDIYCKYKKKLPKKFIKDYPLSVRWSNIFFNNKLNKCLHCNNLPYLIESTSYIGDIYNPESGEVVTYFHTLCRCGVYTKLQNNQEYAIDDWNKRRVLLTA